MKQNQKNGLTTVALIAALLVATTQAGFFEDLTVYLWNFYIYQSAVGSVFSCWMVGGWGLFWDDDDGLMINTCMEMYGGSMVTFPVEYQFN